METKSPLDVAFTWHLCDRDLPQSLPKKDGDYFVAVRYPDRDAGLYIDILSYCIIGNDIRDVPYEWATGDVVAWAKIDPIRSLSELIAKRDAELAE